MKAGEGFKRILKENDCENACSLYEARKEKLKKTKQAIQDKDSQELIDAEISTLETYLNLKFVKKIGVVELKIAKSNCKDAYLKRKRKLEKSKSETTDSEDKVQVGVRNQIIQELSLDPKVEGYAVFPNLLRHPYPHPTTPLTEDQTSE